MASDGMGKRITRRSFLKLGAAGLSALGASCVVGPLYAARIEPWWVEVRQVEVGLSGLSPMLDGLTIAHLTDLHVGPHIDAEFVRRCVGIVNDLTPDLVVLMGDFVYRRSEYGEICARELSALRAKRGVYAVLGNHDVWTDADYIAGELHGAGISVLRDRSEAVEVEGLRLWLVGIEDRGHTGGYFSDFRAFWESAAIALQEIVEPLPRSDSRLLLVHNPDFCEMVPSGVIDFALCGHTHGGQVRLPFIGPPLVPSCFGTKYASGLVQAPGTRVYVSRGLGMIDPPVRLFCLPELTLVRLIRG